jgi:hypothetical protein
MKFLALVILTFAAFAFSIPVPDNGAIDIRDAEAEKAKPDGGPPWN